jgi:hypothetical protein
MADHLTGWEEDINLDDKGKEADEQRPTFKENVIEDLPPADPRDPVRPIGNMFRNVSGAKNAAMNKAAAQVNRLEKRRARNKRAKQSRRKNRKK